MLDINPSPPAPQSDPAAPVLDATSLAQLRALDPSGGSAFILRVLDTYQRSLQRQVALVQAAHQAGDTDSLSRAMHTLKSASASVGALRLASQCEGIEHRLRLGDHSGLDERVQAFLAEARQVAQAVAAHVGSVAS